MGVDRRLTPLLAEFFVLVLIDVDDHGVAADASISDILRLLRQATLGHLLNVLFGRLDFKGHTTGPATLGEHAHGAATPRRISGVIGERVPVSGIVGVMNHLSHRGGLQRG